MNCLVTHACWGSASAAAGACASYGVSTIGKALGATAMAVTPLQGAIFCGICSASTLITGPAVNFLEKKLTMLLGINTPKSNTHAKFAVFAGLEIAGLAVIVFATSHIAPSLAISYTAAFATLGVIGVSAFTALALAARLQCLADT